MPPTGGFGAGAGTNVDAPVPAYLLVFLVLPVSSDPYRPLAPPQVDTTLTAPYTASPASARAAEGGAIHRLCNGGGTWGLGMLTTECMASPAVFLVTTCTARRARRGTAFTLLVNE